MCVCCFAGEKRQQKQTDSNLGLFISTLQYFLYWNVITEIYEFWTFIYISLSLSILSYIDDAFA